MTDVTGGELLARAVANEGVKFVFGLPCPEIDPFLAALDANGIPLSVNDVVIGQKDGGLICCQCKKNQTDFDAWSVADLKGELAKSSQLLASNPKSSVRFERFNG